MILHVSANVKSCLQLVEDTKAVACRALWRVKEEDISMAKNQICSHGLKLDDAIIGMEGVQFFVSCITEIEQNVTHRITPGEDERGFNPEKIVYPGVSYLIAYRETSKCSKDAIFRALYEADMDPTINAIKTRNSGSLPGYEDVAIKKLAQVRMLELKVGISTNVQRLLPCSMSRLGQQWREGPIQLILIIAVLFGTV